MSRGIDWVTPEEADFLIHFGWACVSLFVGWCGWSVRQRWKRRWEDATAEIVELRDAVADARFTRTARQQPVPLPEWVDPAERVPSRCRHWHIRLMWPGLNPGLPFGYGAAPLNPAHLEVEPWAPPPAPTDEQVLAWRLDPQAQSWPPLTTGELRVEMALTEFEQLYASATQQMEVTA